MKKIEKISIEKTETLYRKIGKRYYPVREEVGPDSFPDGAHLVIVSPGGTRTIKYSIDPPYSELLAAAEVMRDEMVGVLIKEGKTVGHGKDELTKEQVKVWEEWNRVCGGCGTVKYLSAVEVVDAGINALIKKVKEENN